MLEVSSFPREVWFTPNTEILRYNARVSRFWPLIPFILLLIADQVLKTSTVNLWTANNWAVADAQTVGYYHPVIANFLDLHLTYNTGAAWSLLSGAALPLAILRFLAGIGLLVYVVIGKLPTAYRYIFAVIAAGAIGNSIDGILNGKVTDMLYSHTLSWVMSKINIPSIGTSFPIFNIADSCVVGGTLALVLFSLLERPKAKTKTAEPSSE